MTMPAPRNLVNTAEDCPHCKNEGGPYVVSMQSTRSWPNGNHGQCGGGSYERSGGRSVATYRQGSRIDISFFITAQHGGRHAFRLCPEDTPSEKCFSQYTLERADGKGKYLWVGNRGGAGDGGSYSRDTKRGLIGEDYKITYKLPDDLACERCTLQWWWTTSNSCQIPGAPGWMATTMSSCKDYYPEEFWNCADITISGDGVSSRKVKPKRRRNKRKRKKDDEDKNDKKKGAKSSNKKDDKKKPSSPKAKSSSIDKKKKKNSQPPSKKKSPSQKRSPPTSKAKGKSKTKDDGKKKNPQAKKPQSPKGKSKTGSSDNKKGSRKNLEVH